MTCEFTKTDIVRLDTQRIKRFRHHFPYLLADSNILITGLDRSLIIVVTPGKARRLIAKLAELRWFAYLYCAASKLSIYEGNDLVLSTPTLPVLIDCVGISNLRSKLGKSEQSQELKIMPTAAPAKNRTSSRRNSNSKAKAETTTSTKTRTSARSKKNNLGATTATNLSTRIETFAQKTGQDPTVIALNLINNLPADIIEQGFMQMADAHLQQLRNELMGIGGSGSSTTTATPTATKTSNGTAAPSKAKTTSNSTSTAIRFKPFTIARSMRKTIGSFLDANPSKFDEQARVEFIEQLATLPETEPSQPEALETLAEMGLARILKAYPAKNRPERKDIIKAAKGMMSGNSEES